jgi:hypothetical protein
MLFQSLTNSTSSPKESNPDCSTNDAGFLGNLAHGHAVQLMLKQGALTGAAKTQDPIDVNRGDFHPKTALNIHERLHEPFPPQLIAE